MSFTAVGYDVDIQTKITEAVSVFSDRVLRISDSAVLKKFIGKLVFPICGIIYEGIISDGDEGDEGRDSYVYVAVIILADSKAREARQDIEATEIPALLDACRGAIVGTLSPSKRPWQFVMEVPVDLGAVGMAYYQKWKTKGLI